MSQWTHVTGAIRVDWIINAGNRGAAIRLVKSVFGKTCNPKSSQEEWQACTVPRGSEGSLQYHIHEYDTGLPWVIVPVWGDLRDYDNVDEIRQWFFSVCQQLLIRQAILEIEVEGRDAVVVQYKRHEIEE